MIFPQGWQVDVVKPEGAGNYPDLAHGTDRYVVGLPGKPFEVKVTAPAPVFSSAPVLRASLAVEGRSVGISFILTERHPSYTFQGFVNTVKGEHRTSQFLFGKPSDGLDSAPSAPSSAKPDTGGIEVSVEHVVQAPGVVAPPQHVSSPAAASAKAVEGMQQEAVIISHHWLLQCMEYGRSW